jgi:ppGpp synthetase/RelA/SpoT-type nucleotidyltranferase
MYLHTDYQPHESPLFMVMDDPVLHEFISYLDSCKRDQEMHPENPIRIELSRALLAQVKEKFRQRILRGERNLHIASHVLASHFLGGDVELHSNVIGMLPVSEDRPFLIRERITGERLFSHTDLDLGNHMLLNFMYQGKDGWAPLTLAANFVEYLPKKRGRLGVNRITSRVKAEEELWNKVVDELFTLDELVKRDKHLYQFSKFVKDVFGIKIVCENESFCHKILECLRHLRVAEINWGSFPDPDGLQDASTRAGGDRLVLEFIETKDYLTCDPSEMKKTGWKALKSVVRWNNELLEIQIQPLDNYYMELDHMAGPSHNSFKLIRDTVREEVSAHIPLYGFYRDLLRSIFLDSGVPISAENATVVITD